VFALYKLFATPQEQAELAARYRAGNFGYGHAKLALFEKLDAHFAPYRERYEKIKDNHTFLEEVLQDGAQRARAVALPVLDRVRERCGYRRR
jgi:tryptophanyl-tRNA synthetase